jgi:filamentous hemagglutinin
MTSKHYSSQQDYSIEQFKLKPLSACIRAAIAGGVLLTYALPSNAELPIPAQVWATMGSATNQVLGNTLQINQKTDRAILNWERFNVGAKNRVNFQQPRNTSIALNRIFQDDPSRILGKITANGQIYLYNKNGFVFGKDSTVNVNTLVASALNISDDVFKNSGIANKFNADSGAALEGNPNATAEIKVEKGANMHVGELGRLILAAPNVTNKGNLTADKFGQILLVASKDKVYLQPTNTNSPFSGLLVEVGSGGKVTNLGNILTRQGNVTLAGFAVNQAGRVSATTAVNVKGSIRLLAREGLGADTTFLTPGTTTRSADLKDGLGTQSKVTFAPGSVTQVIADAQGGKAIDEQKQPLSYLEVSGHTVHLQAGSAIGVPGGKVDIAATNDPINPTGVGSTQGRILLDKGAMIDVSGTKNIKASVTRNVVDVPVQSFELRDSPYQRGGVLQGKTIRVDIRDKNPIVDFSGAVARIERSIDERLGKGGTINLTSGGDVIVNPNAKINISGGSINYQSGYINTTKLLTDYGSIVDIGDADPNQPYKSVFGFYNEVHQKWGVTKVWQNDALLGKGRFEQGYVEGLDAGSLNIKTPALSWNGDLIAGAASGIFQRNAEARPYGGEFLLDTKSFNSAQNVLFETQGNGLAIAEQDKFPEGRDNRPADLVFSTEMINRSGVQKFNVKTLGDASFAADTKIVMTPGKSGTIANELGGNIAVNGSEFALVAGNIDVNGSIYAPGGTIRLSSGFDAEGTDDVTQNFNVAARLTLSSLAKLDVSGRWVNDFALGLDTTPTEATVIDGGTVSLTSSGDLDMQPGSAIHADGGGWLAQDGGLTAGESGSISLAAIGNQNNGETSLLHLNGALSGYGLSEDGSLSLSSGKVIVGTPSADELQQSPLALGIKDGHLDLNGIESFGNITLSSNGNSDNLVVKGQTKLGLVQQNLILQDGFREQSSAKSILPISDVVTLPEHLRKPVDLSLTAKNGVVLETGSKILGDKQADIKLETASGGIYVDGLIDAPAGTITLSSKSDEAILYDPAQAVWLGQQGWLRAMGTTRLNPVDALSRRTGEVLDGGSVTLATNRGYVVLEQGSKIDVSGTKATLDIVSDDPVNIRYAATEVGSNAGKISLTAAEGAILDGSLKGMSGTPTTNDGRIDLVLDRINRKSDFNTGVPFGALTLAVRQDQQKLLPNNSKFGDDLDALGMNGKATISSNAISNGGFDDVRLVVFNAENRGDGLSTLTEKDSSVSFLGNVDLSADARIDIDASTIKWQGLNNASAGKVNLNTAYLRTGSSLIREPTQMPTLGGGQFTANTRWTEFGGGSRWDGFANLKFNSDHDLRTVGVFALDSTTDGKNQSDYVGKFVTAANVNLTASQIYPSTLTKFTFAVENNPNGQITIASSGKTDAAPLSAGGVLNFQAPAINQNGTIKAPFGMINLTAGKALTLGKGSLTSVSGAGQLIPFGVTSGGLDWLYQTDSSNSLLVNAPPEKKLALSAPQINIKKGSTVDLSGGGDLLAYEFQPGIGGSFDYLDKNSPTYNGGFAILPGLSAALAPFDHDQARQGNYQAPVGGQVFLNGTDTLAAGFYTILPARYALLPSAYLVTPQAGTQDQRATTFNSAGLPTVAGYNTQAGVGTKNPRWSGFQIESGADIRKHSQYDEQTANSFFTQRALTKATNVPILPKDSGQIIIKDATIKLALEGDFKVSPATNGRGAKMDIAAKKLKIVNAVSATPTDGFLEILARDLTRLKVGSLLLGGERNNNLESGTTDISVTSEQVIFDNNAQVSGTDLIAAATEQVSVKNGASLVASGSIKTGDTQFNIVGDGALLRVSADQQIALNRTGSSGVSGRLSIDSGAKLGATRSMLLDASQTTTLDGGIDMKNGSLNLSANSINIGDTNAASGNALNLTNQKLQTLGVDELILSSRSSINFYGDVGLKNTAGRFDPLAFNNLVLNASGFSGFGNSNQTINLQANNLQLQNTLNSVANTQGTGHSQLNLSANSYRQGNGTFDINGFDSVNIDAAKDFTATGNGKLNIAANLHLTSGYLTSVAGKKLDINVAGYQALLETHAGAILPEASDFGGTINLTANAINFNAKALLPSGKLGLHSLAGDIVLGSQANLDMAGRKVRFADTFDYTPGGIVSAVAEQGKITLAAGSKVDVSTGGGTAKGGKLDLQAANQSLELLGQLKAKAGSAELDVSRFIGKSGFDNLMKALTTAGVTDSISVRSRLDDIAQGAGNTIAANNITLTADQGDVRISGTLDANGLAQGGAIKLYAGDKVALENGAVLTAKGIGNTAKGGRVLLSSIDGDQENDIEINGKSLLDVSGGAAGKGGEIVLRTLRSDSNQDGVDDSVAIKPIAEQAQVLGFSRFFAEGVKKYGNEGINEDFTVKGEINEQDITAIKDDTDAYMASATQLNVGNTLGKGIKLRPGIEIDYDGDLTLKSRWDFVTWGDDLTGTGGKTYSPGTLAINASGNLTFEKSLTDGFTLGFDPNTGLPIDVLHTADSWSYQLTAGSDLSAANKSEVGKLAKNITLALNPAFDPDLNPDTSLLKTVVRTGTGDIALTASGNVIFEGKTVTDSSGFNQYQLQTAVYNAGKAEIGKRYGSYDESIGQFLPGAPDYPLAGGDLVINAGHDIKGALNQDSFINKWLVRQGNQADELSGITRIPTAWGISFSNFSQNVGSFGGGKVDINAGGNINDLAVMMPTTGKQIGQLADPTNPASDYVTNKLQIEGGGQLNVTAGGNIAGGVFYLGQGKGSITAAGKIMGTSSLPDFFSPGAVQNLRLGPQLLIGDTDIALNANQGISISAVSDPMILSAGDTNFFSYSQRSAVRLKSLSGDVHLNANTDVINAGNSDARSGLTKIYPASLYTTAFGGSVSLDGVSTQVSLFPSATANLVLLARDNIGSNFADASAGIGMSDFDPSLLPNALSPISIFNLENTNILGKLNAFGTGSLVHAQAPVHIGDSEYVRIATQQGDIERINFSLPKQAIVTSGRDINSASISIQHANPKDDVSVVSAARDIVNPSERDVDTGVLAINPNKIEVAGAGDVLIKSGRNIDLGTSSGLLTVGNTNNPNLGNSGANMTVLAGLNGAEPNYLGLLKLDADVLKYAENFNKFQQLVTEFMRNRTGNTVMTTKTAFEQFNQLDPTQTASLQPALKALISTKYTDLLGRLKSAIIQFVQNRAGNPSLDETQALEAFARLSSDEYLTLQPKLNNLSNQVLFSELNGTGSASAADPTLGNERGFAAINALYPGTAWKGDLNLFFSTIQTLKDGSINLVVPGGKINAGLASNPNLSKQASDLGIIARGKGDINAFLNDDFIVNQSRVFALGGGDIMVWSSQGDIDAGRGAKSALAAPLPEFTTDENGNAVITFPSAVSGSGIRTAASVTDKNGEPGDVGLFAPGGIVNAGEAGIAGNNVTISATAVLGANNIQIGGVGTGVPAASTASLAAGLTGVSNLTANVSQVAQAAADTSKNMGGADKQGFNLGAISVEFLGFGE